MKILWIVNTIFPAPCEALGLPKPISGGWMYGLATQLKSIKGISLAVSTTYSGSTFKELEIDGIIYYLLPNKRKNKYNRALEQYWLNLVEQWQPDVVHIHGTEFAHGLACMRTKPTLNYIISIQGLVSVCERYYYAGIPKCDIFKNITLRDIIRFDTLFDAKYKFKKQGVLEKEYISNSNGVVGRTSWDYAHVKAINPKVKYHFCNETLRDAFYSTNNWNIDHCTQFSIFLSQATYPLKGLHQVLKAVTLLKDEYPQIKLNIAGIDITKCGTLKESIKLSGYGKYIRNTIKKGKLSKYISFMGCLSEQQMVEAYQKAHVFICPSSVENSPNSLAEAQLIGTPTISAYVGGVPDMVRPNVDGLLYRFEEIEMLAECIRKIFNNKELAQQFSTNGIDAARKRHDKNLNLDNLIAIYGHI